MDTIKVEQIRREDGLDFHDKVRDGRSPDFDTIFVSSLLRKMIATINELVEEVKVLKNGGVSEERFKNFITEEQAEEMIRLFGKNRNKKKRG